MVTFLRAPMAEAERPRPLFLAALALAAGAAISTVAGHVFALPWLGVDGVALAASFGVGALLLLDYRTVRAGR